MFCILLWVVVTWVYVIVNTHQTEPLKSGLVIVCNIPRFKYVILCDPSPALGILVHSLIPIFIQTFFLMRLYVYFLK